MAAEIKPLLVFPRRREAERAKRPSGFGGPKTPARARQLERLGPKYQALQQAFEARLAKVQALPEGTVPEMVLVLELSEPVEAFKSALVAAGLEWLDEVEVDDVQPDDDFFNVNAHGERTDKTLAARVYLTMANQQALAELHRLWNRWRDDENAEWAWGQGAWKKVFPKIRDIRPWSAEDRLRDTGLLQAWQDRLVHGGDFVRFEAELWYRQSIDQRQRAATTVRRIIEAAGGQVSKTVDIQDIRYHALLGRVPAGVAQQIINTDDVQLLNVDDVMFLRPTGQVACPTPPPEAPPAELAPANLPGVLDLPPIVAVLDGIPVENHDLLRGRLVVDDPDGWSAAVPSGQRYHGTCMSSLVLHGDLNAREAPLARRIYVRPVLKPHPWAVNAGEFVPDDELTVDLVHRAVRRLYDGAANGAGVAPSVRIINLSICDSARVFTSALSPWAKLLDWLAWRYQVLFVVSAGNHVERLELDIPPNEVVNPATTALEAAVLRAVIGRTRNRRLLAPAESINAITVGAVHKDASVAPAAPHVVDPLVSANLPSPLNAHGLGYRRAIKPEVLLPGGRQVYQVPPILEATGALEVTGTHRPPGQLAAVPGTAPGQLNGVGHSRGTSNAAALATRLASRLHDVVESLREQPGGELLNQTWTTVLLKALLVHGASWGAAAEPFLALLTPRVGGRKIREHVSRFLGYGEVAPEYCITCTDQRATVLGGGMLSEGEAHEYSFPLPPSLSGVAVFRRLTITLAWISPVAPGTQKYRKAHLWFAPANRNEIAPTRDFYDHQAVGRGSVQHEVFVGEKASVFQDGDVLRITVNCREDAAALVESVPYGLAVSLEVAEGIQIPIYEEIRARVAPRVEVQPPVQ